MGLILHIVIGGLHGIYSSRFIEWSDSWLYSADICEARYGWRNFAVVEKCQDSFK
jgi:hypothetical protein